MCYVHRFRRGHVDVLKVAHPARQEATRFVAFNAYWMANQFAVLEKLIHDNCIILAVFLI